MKLSFSYLGTRQYIHGTSIFNALSTVAQSLVPPGYINRLRIRQPSTHNLVLSYEPNSYSADLLIAEARLSTTGTTTANLYLFADMDSPVLTATSSHFEDSIMRISQFSKQKAVARTISHLVSPIETAVYLTKHYHNYLFPQNIKHKHEKWVFTGLLLNRPLFSPSRTEVMLKTNISNRFTKSRLILDDIEVGHIEFTLSSQH